VRRGAGFRSGFRSHFNSLLLMRRSNEATGTTLAEPTTCAQESADHDPSLRLRKSAARTVH
jgi:hypothetical protein